ncbi:MAG: DUF4919 domain-containing protein [Rikenellaceae bacterium]
MKYLIRGGISFVVVTIMSLTLLRAAIPVEDDIVEQISSPKSDNYYPNLQLRYEVGDPTLTLENYHYLYYGFAYQEQYKPLAVNPHMDKFLLLASGLDIDSPNPDVLRDLVVAGDDALIHDPFNPKVWNMLAYAYGALGEKDKEIAAAQRVEMILAVIKNSGSGIKQNSPQHIIMFDHALDLLAAENISHRDAMVVSRTVEFIPLVASRKVDGNKIRGFYFDFGRIYWNKPDSVTYKRDRTWQFNNLPPKEYK